MRSPSAVTGSGSPQLRSLLRSSRDGPQPPRLRQLHSRGAGPPRRVWSPECPPQQAAPAVAHAVRRRLSSRQRSSVALLGLCVPTACPSCSSLCPGAATHLSCILALLLWRPRSSQMPVFFLLPSLWGVGDAVWQTQNNGEWPAPRPLCSATRRWQGSGQLRVWSPAPACPRLHQKPGACGGRGGVRGSPGCEGFSPSSGAAVRPLRVCSGPRCQRRVCGGQGHLHSLAVPG